MKPLLLQQLMMYWCDFNVRSKADVCQLNLPHSTNSQKVEKQKKIKSKEQ